jgi:2-polyprenyl-6-methoxyphenol hydroxylase-like FAD-dependent oxidoreductase
MLYETLAETKDNLSQALPRYQNLRQEDIKALIRLVKISYPWQYNQNVLQKRLWSINFLLRLLLNKIFPFLISPHSFLLLQQHELSYSEILSKSDRTTKILFILIGLIAFILVFLKFRV